jgi:RNA polymerase sigma-70 factor (ECF subfamily)
MREEGGRVLALLAARINDVDLADDCVQDALVTALGTWPRDGVPTNPPGWLYTVAYHRAIDRLRRADVAQRRAIQAATDRALTGEPYEEEPMGDATDERLRVVLLCCHPALSLESQVALTLRLVGGLTAAEIAAAYLVPEATLAQRIARAKRKIREARIPLRMPDRIEERMAAVKNILYGMFNEGYLPRGKDAPGTRPDLAREALRLTENLHTLVPDDPELDALLALQLFASARHSTRVDANGDLVLLADQDRRSWDGDAIARGNGLLADALAANVPGPYQLKALIGAAHANAPTALETDWALIVRFYDQLIAFEPSAVVALNRAIAISMADGPHAGLAAVDSIYGLDSYYLWHAARAEMLHESGRVADASMAFSAALALADNGSERRHLERRLNSMNDALSP